MQPESGPGPGIPSKIGKYEILQELGHGGFAHVYLGYDPSIPRKVAIKRLSAGGDASQVSRFRVEAEAAGSLTHVNIVTIYDFGEDNGTFFLVMQYLEGRDLQKVMRSSELTLLDKMRIMTQIANGLQCAHQHGIVHRDVKPANIMVLPDGTVKIMDFGIARMAESSERLTQTGFVVGTIYYMAPEQLTPGMEADARADIWAFGAMYYELLAGRHPFQDPDLQKVANLIKYSDPVPIQNVCPECPEALAAVLARLLNKDPQQRYQSLDEVLFECAPVLLDLEKQQCAHLAEQARALLDSGNLEEAKQRVERILDLDPVHEQGRALKREWQDKQRDVSLQKQVQGLLEKAEKSAAAHNFDAAIQAVDSAVRLRPRDTSLPARLSEYKSAKERLERSAKMIESARQTLQRDDISEASRLLSDLLAADPDNAVALSLLSDVKERITRRDLERRVRDGLTKARRLLAFQSYLEALQVLQDLAREAPASEEVGTLLATASRQFEEHRRRQAVEAEMEAAKQEIKAQQYEAAISRLEPLLAQSTAQHDIAGLLAYARAEDKAVQEMARIKAAVDSAQALLDARQFDRALTHVEASLMVFPDEPSLLRMHEAVVAARTLEQRRKSLETTLAQVAELERSARFEQALGVLEKALQQIPAEPQLSDALARVRKKREEQQGQERRRQEEERLQKAEEQRRQAIQSVLAQAAELERSARLEQALGVLKKALQQFPAEPQLSEAVARLGKAREEQQAQERRKQEEEQQQQEKEQRQKAQERAAAKERDFRPLTSCIDRQDWLGATQLLRQIEPAYREDPDLNLLTRRVEEGKLRRAALDNLLAQIQALLDAGKADQACDAIARARAEFGADPRLAAAEADAQKIRARDTAFEQAQAAFRVQDWRGAAALLEGLLRQNRGDTAARQLLDQVRERERTSLQRDRRDKGRAQADQLFQSGRFEEAVKLLTELKTEFPDDALIPDDLARAADALRQRARRETYLEARRKTEAAIRAGQFAAAIRVLEDALREFPLDSILLEELKDAQAEQQKQLRKERYGAERRRATALLQDGKFREAIAALEALLHEFPGDAILQQELETARERERQHETLIHEKAEIERSDVRRNFRDRGRAEAGKLLHAGRLDEAVKSLRQLAEVFRDDAAVQEDLKRATEALQERTARETLKKARERALALVQARKFDEAIAALEALQKEFPGDALLPEDLQSTVAARDLQNQREELDRVVEQLEKLYKKGDPKALLEAASQLRADLQDGRVRELSDWARTELERAGNKRQLESAGSLRGKRQRRIAIAVVSLAAAAIAIALLLRKPMVTLSADRSEFHFAVTGGAAPSAQTLTLDASAPHIRWSASSDAGWLSVQPDSGFTPAQVRLAVDPSRAGSNALAHITFATEDRAASIVATVTVETIGSVVTGPVKPEEQKSGTPVAKETKSTTSIKSKLKATDGTAGAKQTGSGGSSTPPISGLGPGVVEPGRGDAGTGAKSLDSLISKQDPPKQPPPCVPQYHANSNARQSGQFKWISSGQPATSLKIKFPGQTDQGRLAGGVIFPEYLNLAITPRQQSVSIKDLPTSCNGWTLSVENPAELNEIDFVWKVR